jgi:hypothetical protein
MKGREKYSYSHFIESMGWSTRVMLLWVYLSPAHFWGYNSRERKYQVVSVLLFPSIVYARKVF